MKQIPLNLQTLYADLAQNAGTFDARPGSIATKTVKGRKYLYATSKDGGSRIERYLGPAVEPSVLAEAERIKHSAALAKAARSTVSLLKQARVPAPSIVLGRVLEVLANAGLFQRGVTLVGTAAYQTYGCLLGVYLPAAALMTNDIDISVAEFVGKSGDEDIEATLKRADPTFTPVWSVEDKLPKIFRSSNGFSVDILTCYGRGRKTPVEVTSLKCAAEALSYQEYAAEVVTDAVALYGSGVLVRVPTPVRYAIHKLIVAQQRKPSSGAKKRKDLMQAMELIDIRLEHDEDELRDELDDARRRGPSWKSAINASLRELGRRAEQGVPPVPVVAKTLIPRTRKK